MSQNINIKINPGSAALAGNPISAIINLSDERENPISYSVVDYSIKMGENTIYEGSATTDHNGEIRLMLSEILESMIEKTEYRYCNLICHREDLKINWSITAGSVTMAGPATYSGRINNRMLRYLNDKGSNIFTFKLLNTGGNFIMTTRTGKRNFSLYRSELMPLYLIAMDGKTITVKGGETVAAQIQDTTLLDLYQIDFPRCVSAVNESEWKIDMDGYSGVKITVIEDPESNENTLFEYRNSFGIRERILCTGGKTRSYEIEDSDISYYDDKYDILSPAVVIPEYSHKYEINTGYLTPERVNAFQAMLLSEEVYIVRDNYLEPVKVRCQSSIPDKITEPVNFAIEVASVAQDKGYVPEFDEGSSSDVRIHNNMFNENYN